MIHLPGYKITRSLYSSDHSTVYAGVREADQQPIALKILKAEAPTPEQVARFTNEYAFTRDLQIPGIRRAFDTLRVEGHQALVLEYAVGKTLRQVLVRQRQPLPVILRVFIQVAETLGRVHQHGIIHKDLNSNNILVNLGESASTGSLGLEIVLIDFGLSSRINLKAPHLGNPGTLEGTLAYLSPEQTGRMNRVVDHRTDLYSLGVTLYEALTGALPFDTEDPMELVHSHLARTPVSPLERVAELPPMLATITLKLLAKNAEDRYRSSFGVKYDLERVLAALEAGNPQLCFPPGEQDHAGRLAIPDRLYGREKAIQALLGAFQRAVAGGRELVILSGPSGVGKSCLARELHRPVTTHRAFFVSGKCDQYRRDLPYQVWIQALGEFIDQLLLENPALLERWKTRLLHALGDNARVLVDLVPGMELLLGEQPPVIPLGPREAQNRLVYLIRRVLAAIATAETPLVVFLDDLQWADHTSLALLEAVLGDHRIEHLLVVAAHRGETENTDWLDIADIQHSGVGSTTLGLDNLTEADIAQLVADALESDLTTVKPLATLVHQKTQGNPFFAGQFLRTVYEEGALRFDFDERQWRWDLPVIRALDITDNVIAMMAGQFRKLPATTRTCLSLAACVGNRFDLATLAALRQEPGALVAEHLEPALVAGLVAPLNDNYRLASLDDPGIVISYRFVHDRVQQAVYSHMDAMEQSRTHLAIGRLLLDSIPVEQRTERIFDIAQQWYLGRELLTRRVDRERLAVLSLSAGRQAKTAGAYISALTYLRAAIHQLLHDASFWDSHRRLLLALHHEAAETAYLQGDFATCEALLTVADQHMDTVLDRVRGLEIRVLSASARGRSQEALTVGREALTALRIPVPRSEQDTALLLHELRQRLADPHTSLVAMEAMEHPESLAAMRILAGLFATAYTAAPTLLPALTLSQIRLTLERGVAPESAFALAAYGFLLCALTDDLTLGYQAGQMALQLAERPEARRSRAKTEVMVGFTVRPWREPLRETLADFLGSYRLGLESGDLEFAAYAAFHYCAGRFFAGENLSLVDEDLSRFDTRLEELRQRTPLTALRIFRQSVAELRGGSTPGQPLSGEFFDAQTELPRLQQNNQRSLLGLLHCHRLILAYSHGDTSTARQEAHALGDCLDGVAGTVVVPLAAFYSGLAELNHYPKAPTAEQDAIHGRVASALARLERWSRAAPSNHRHRWLLLEAEQSRVSGSRKEARELYDQAIQAAHDNGYRQEEALARELAGRFQLACGFAELGRFYLGGALRTYRQWGGDALAARLSREFPTLAEPSIIREPTVTQHPTINTRQDSLATLDLYSILKASQTLSGEIVLSNLLRKLMQVLVENAGAQRGVLLSQTQDGLAVEAEGGPKAPVTVQRQTLEQYEELPHTLLHYVARTRREVVLEDAQRDSRFSQEPYLKARRVRSALCFPIVAGHQLRLILYLENNALTGAFTPERLEVLRMLSTQISISLENARLYENLEAALNRQIELTNAYSRFVPREFLGLLGKESILDVTLGDQVQQEMTVLFSDIRGFTALSEQLDPAANFAFINHYLQRMEPAIGQFHGFIDKYIGDAIMALFPTCADDGLRGAIAMQSALADFNEERGGVDLAPIHIGIGLNTGMLMLGTVGGQQRMDGTVISDAVNLAARVESMTKRYGATLLITGETRARLRDPDAYSLRRLDRVRAVGKSTAVTLYQVLDGEAPALRERRMAGRNRFEAAVEHYQRGEFANARAIFQELLRSDSDDRATRIYVERCQRYEAQGRPEHWEGVEVLESK